MKRPGNVFLAALLIVIGLAAGILLRLSIFTPPAAPSKDAFLLSGIPDVRQSTTYSCGAAALQAVLSYYGIDSRERTLMEALKTSKEAGTSPEAIIQAAKELGLDARLKEKLTFNDLEEAVRRGIPVICAIQAWTDERPAGFSWEEDWEDGHYVIVLGLDDGNVYLEDPSLLGTRGVIPRTEFLSRWHDYTGDPPFDATDRSYIRLGIFVTGKEAARPPSFTRID